MKLKTWLRLTKAAFTDFDSSFITGVAWEDGVLFVRMGERGSIFAYADVPRQVFLDFVAAESKGRFYNQEVKGQFDSESLGEDGTPIPPAPEVGDDDWSWATEKGSRA